jgi:YggT family protein
MVVYPVAAAVEIAIVWFLNILRGVLFVRVIMSWISMGRPNPIMNFVAFVTEPFLAPIRWVVNKSPLGGGMLDFSVLILFLLIMFLQEPLRLLARMIPF